MKIRSFLLILPSFRGTVVARITSTDKVMMRSSVRFRAEANHFRYLDKISTLGFFYLKISTLVPLDSQ